jgi:3-isopropylmalate/(R)-2-methylmalate dehydratase small subunit
MEIKENQRIIVQGRAIPLRGNNIDTDRIIPARYLRFVTFENLGQYAFQDERFDEDGREKEHPFNDERYKGAEILLANKNFLRGDFCRKLYGLGDSDTMPRSR